MKNKIRNKINTISNDIDSGIITPEMVYLVAKSLLHHSDNEYDTSHLYLGLQDFVPPNNLFKSVTRHLSDKHNKEHMYYHEHLLLVIKAFFKPKVIVVDGECESVIFEHEGFALNLEGNSSKYPNLPIEENQQKESHHCSQIILSKTICNKFIDLFKAKRFANT